MSPRVPYIGITDFSSKEEVERMLSIFQRHPLTRHKLMVGVMMSYKTLHSIPTKWSNAFPKKEDIAKIFSSDVAYNCLHYADYDKDGDLWKSLTRAIGYGGIGIHALQLDMIWPDPFVIAQAVHVSRKQLEVIIQVNTNALDLVDNDPDKLVRRLKNYEGILDRVLLDKSMGRGKGMDAGALRPFLDAISEKLPWLSLGVAGGLGPTTMHLLGNLPNYYPFLSIDAQGQLRPSKSALDPIDWDMATKYLEQALEIFS